MADGVVLKNDRDFVNVRLATRASLSASARSASIGVRLDRNRERTAVVASVRSCWPTAASRTPQIFGEALDRHVLAFEVTPPR
jgi:hypothetical protein